MSSPPPNPSRRPSGIMHILNDDPDSIKSRRSKSPSKRTRESASDPTSPRKTPRTSMHDTPNGNHESGSAYNGSSHNVMHARRSTTPRSSHTPKAKPVAIPSSPDHYELDPTQAPSSSAASHLLALGSSIRTASSAALPNGNGHGAHRDEDDAMPVPSSMTGLEDEGGEEAEGAEFTADEVDGEEGDGASDDDEEDEEDEEDDDDDDASSVDIEGEGRAGSVIVVSDTEEGPGAGSPRALKKEPSLLPDEGAAAEAGEADGEAVNTLQAKKKRPARKRSPSEELPAPKLEMLTVRLEHEIGSLIPTEYKEYLEWNILDAARDEGMMAGWNPYVPEAGPSGTNAEEEEGDEGAEGEDGEPVKPNANGMDLDPITGAAPLGPPGGLDPLDALVAKYAHLDQPQGKGKKSKKPQDAYDISDGFIDDSEIMQDAPTHYARTVREGFFVQMGDVEVIMEEPEQAKPRARPSRRTAKPVTTTAVRTRKSLARLVGEEQRRQAIIKRGGNPGEPESVYIDPEEEADEVIEVGDYSVDRSIFVSASKEPEQLPPFPTYPLPVRSALLHLRDESLKHTWDLKAKGKFPTELHEPLRRACEAAWQHDMYDIAAEDRAENFFAALSSCLPYNTFTLKKLSAKKTIEDFYEFLQKCEDRGLEELRKLVDAGMTEFEEKKRQEEAKYELALQAWDDEHGANGNGTPKDGVNGAATSDNLASDAATRMDVDNSGDEVEAAIKVVNERPKKPITRFTLSGEISTVMCQLYENAAVMRSIYAKVENWRLKGAETYQLKEGTQTAKLNQRIMLQFPPDSVSGTMLSRQKTKVAVKKQTAKDEKP